MQTAYHFFYFDGISEAVPIFCVRKLFSISLHLLTKINFVFIISADAEFQHIQRFIPL